MDQALLSVLDRIAVALERLAPPAPAPLDIGGADAFVWVPEGRRLDPVHEVAGVPLRLLAGIDRQRQLLLDNTARFAAGQPANNAMLWGARGTGKSSLVKAVHGELLAVLPAVPSGGIPPPHRLALIEIGRDDLSSLPLLLDLLRREPRRFLLFCDDLSFEREDADYKALKSVLDGGLRGRPANVLFYATSNRRHLMPRDMIENEQSTAISPAEAIEEKISLSDRFGLWIGFHGIDQATFLATVEAYVADRGLAIAPDRLRREAIEWATTRGARSGRVAWQFVEDLTGRLRMASAADPPGRQAGAFEVIPGEGTTP